MKKLSLSFIGFLWLILSAAADPKPTDFIWVSRQFEAGFACVDFIQPPEVQQIVNKFKPFTSFGGHLIDRLTELFQEHGIIVLDSRAPTPPEAQPAKDADILEIGFKISAQAVTQAEKLGFFPVEEQTWVSIKVNGPPQCKTAMSIPKRDRLCEVGKRLVTKEVPILGYLIRPLQVCQACIICPSYSQELRFLVPKAQAVEAQKYLNLE